jgi:hypothetical protein
MRSLIFLHHRDEANSGDMMSSPVNYFDWRSVALMGTRGVFDSGDFPDQSDVILGGGGLVGNGHFSLKIDHQLNKSDGRRILWGAGHNRHCYPYGFRATGNGPRRLRAEIRGWLVRRGWRNPSSWSRRLTYGLDENEVSFLESFGLVGVRDWGTPYRWVPCASCLHPAIDRHRDDTPRHEVVFVDHPKFFAIDVKRAPKLSNLKIGIDDMIAFIASGRSVVTSSYHVAYWGVLLGRRVVIAPWSTKFLRSKWPVELAPDLDGLAYHLAHARVFPEALSEARDANLLFAKEVSAFLGLQMPVQRFMASPRGNPIA